MEIIKSIKMSKQPLVWRKAALQETPSGWTWKDVVFYPIHSFLYILNNNPSLLVDELIMGSNPILSLLLLHKLSKECVKIEEYKKVGLFFINQSDYWAYDIIKNKDFFDTVYENYGIKSSNIEELINNILDGISREYLDIYIINDNDLRISYHIKDNYTKGWIFHLLNKTDIEATEVNGFIKIQNDIKDIVQSELLRTLYKDKIAKKVKWENSNKKHYPIIMSKNIKVTSLPQGWINTASEEKDGVIYFQNNLIEYCYGSAVSIATIPELLRKKSLEEIKL
jgi:hypothetical protein